MLAIFAALTNIDGFDATDAFDFNKDSSKAPRIMILIGI